MRTARRLTIVRPWFICIVVASIELHKPAMEVRRERFPGVNQYVLQVEAFGRSLRDGVAYPCPLEFVRGTQSMMDRAYGVASDIRI